MGRIALSLHAELEATRAFDWIASQDPVRADHWYRALAGVLQSLEVFPERCPLAPESRLFGEQIRQLIFGNYRTLFRIDGDRVRVLHIRHGARGSLHGSDLEDADS
jgi:plasmid stabilization system protein ParE